MSPSVFRVYFAGMCSVVVTVGVARFAYTPLLPVMQGEAGLGDAMGGFLATMNYLGYLVGVLIAANLKDPVRRFWLYRASLLMAIAGTALMAWSNDPVIWMLSRFLTGVCGAGGMILASGMVLKWLVDNGHPGELGIHFVSIGLSIMITALFVDQLLAMTTSWDIQWLVFAGLAILFSLPAWFWMPKPDAHAVAASASSAADNPPARTFMVLMFLAYFCAGYGFAVNATFIVDIVESLPAMQGQGSLVFVLMGLVAAPSLIIWDRIARRMGYLKSLFWTYIFQIIGLALPALSDHVLLVALGGLMFGGTFVASVGLVLTMAGRFFPSNPAKFMGKLTLAYGVAQIVAPAVTGLLVEANGNYETGLYLSSIVMIVGALLILYLILAERNTVVVQAGE